MTVESAESSPRRVVVALIFALVTLIVALRYSGTDSPAPLLDLAAICGWIALFSLATLGLGAPIVRALTRNARCDTVVSAAAGAGMLAIAAGSLGSIGLLGPTALNLLLAASAAWGAVEAWRSRLLAARSRSIALTVPFALVAFGAVVTLLALATPAPFYDQFHYHLAFPERWLRDGGLSVVPRHAYSYFPANMGLLYVYALAGPGVGAAQAINAWFGALALLAVARLARTLGGGKAAGWWSASIFIATPSVLLVASWAGADLGVMGFGAVAWLLVVRTSRMNEESARRRGFFLAGAATGLAIGCKYLAVATVALPVGVTIAACAISRQRDARFAISRSVRSLVPWGIGVMLLFAPWAVRNTVLTGDPVFPFFAETFVKIAPTEALEDAVATAGEIVGSPSAAERVLAIATLRTFSPKGEAGTIGPVWLALIPLWVAMTVASRRVRRSAVLIPGLIAGIVLWAQFHQLGRYLVPVLIPAAAGIGIAIERLSVSFSRTVRVPIVLTLGFLCAWGASGGINEHTLTRIACTLGRADVDRFMSQWVSYWPAIEPLNETLPAGATVMLVAESRSLHIDRDIVFEDPFHTPRLLEHAESERDERSMARAIAAEGVTHLLFNDHEARRIARLNHRKVYFGPASSDTTARLQRFMRDCVDVVSRTGPVTIYQLDESCGEVPTRTM